MYRYYRLAYDFLFMTDHDAVTYPWNGEWASGLYCPTLRLGFTPQHIRNHFLPHTASAQELNYDQHHIVQMFSDFEQPEPDYFEDEFALMTVASAHDEGAGRFFIAHPGRYVRSLSQLDDATAWLNREFYVNMHLEFPSIVGMEIFNQADRYNTSWAVYDDILSALMARRPQRPIWAIGADDNHGNHYGYNHVTMMLPYRSMDNLESAFEQGAFFATSFFQQGPPPVGLGETGSTVRPWQLDARGPRSRIPSSGREPANLGWGADRRCAGNGRFQFMPTVNRIDVCSVGYITIAASQYTDIIWTTSGGVEVARGNSVNYRTNANIIDFVRATLVWECNANGLARVVTLTQPFGVASFDEDSWFFYFAPFVPEENNEGDNKNDEDDYNDNKNGNAGCGNFGAATTAMIFLTLGGGFAIFLSLRKKD